jgi:Ca2+-binding RTX toxin-like protein
VARPPVVRFLPAAFWIAPLALGLAFPVRAAVVVTDAPAFVVAIDNNDAVSVDCSGGFVRVFDDAVPTAFTTTCAAVTSLTVTATGNFDNTIDLSGVTAAAFTALSSTASTVSIASGGGVDVLTGSELADTITGGPGNETQQGGAGNDIFIWNPGDGSDTLVGGAGTDTMLFNGAGAAEVFAVTAVGSAFRFTRDLGGIIMDATTVETLILNGLGGNDSATVGNLTGVADLTTINLLMGDGDDIVDASAQANASIALTIDGGANNDNLTGSANADTISGGAGNDSITGLAGVDVMDGGDGDDTITGGPGNETQQGGAGNDIFIWNPGDGSDTLVGGAGIDTMLFNGAGAAEVFAVTAVGSGFRLTRNVGNIVMDATETEAIALNALGGDDTVTTVGLAGTSQSLNGGTQTIADILTVDAQGACAASSPGSITIAGAQPITFTEFETVNLLNQCAAAAAIPTLSQLAVAAFAVFLALAALVVMRLQSSA